jgi:hypothetical protein
MENPDVPSFMGLADAYEHFKGRAFVRKFFLVAILLVGLSLSSAFSDCDKRGFLGPTRDRKGNVFVYYRNNREGTVTYFLENRNDFPVDVVFAVGDLRDGKFLQRRGCDEVRLDSQSALRIYRVHPR